MRWTGTLGPRSRVLLIALGILVVCLALLSAMGVAQLRNIESALGAREHESLRQCARFFAHEVSYHVMQDEGDILRSLDVQSTSALTDSLARAATNAAHVTLFVFLEDGGVLHPPDTLAVPEPAAAGVRAMAESRDVLMARLGSNRLARVAFRRDGLPVAVSLYALRADGRQGLLALCWAPDRVNAWLRASALTAVTSACRIEVDDLRGVPLFEYPAPSGAGRGFADDPWTAVLPLPDGNFPWVLRASPADPGQTRKLFRSQMALHGGLLALLALFMVIGIWVLTAATLKEIALGQVKTEFAANVSHELRTPLALIRGAADSLAERPGLDSAQRERYLSIIRRESLRLTDLVATVMDFSRLERGMDVCDLKTDDVADSVGEFVGNYRAPIEEQGFRFDVSIPSAPLWARLDRRALHIILTNLLDNAVKFSGDRKDITLSVEGTTETVDIRVKDQGIGIAQDDQRRIFDSFLRLERPPLKKTRGTGIGLALVRRLVQAHEGSVEVCSAPGEGATFTVKLPRLCAGGGA